MSNIAEQRPMGENGEGMVIFDTTYCVQTQEEIDQIIQDVKDIYIYYARKEAEKKRELGG